MSYQFQNSHKDRDITDIQREIEDNFATNSEVGSKYNKVIDIVESVPVLTDMADGETKVYNDGADVWRYYRVGSRLFKTQLTEV